MLAHRLLTDALKVGNECIEFYSYNPVFLEYLSRNSFYEYGKWIALCLYKLSFTTSVSNTKTYTAYFSSENQRRAISNTFQNTHMSKIFSITTGDRREKRFFLVLLILLAIFLPLILFLLALSYVNKTSSFTVIMKYVSISIYISIVLTKPITMRNKVIISNDHLFYFRALAHGVREIKGHMIYVQHACVTSNFPPLTIFDEVYLDGPVSQKLYKYSYTDNTEIVFNGLGRFQYIRKPQQSHESLRVGIGVTSVDFQNNYVHLRKILQGNQCSHVVFRFHPSVKKSNASNFIGELSSELKLEMQDSLSMASDESLADFFEKIDILITSASSLIIDSLLANIPAFSLDLENIGDYYSLEKFGVCKQLDLEVPLSVQLDSYDTIEGLELYFGSGVKL